MKKMWKMLGVFCFACGLLFTMSLTGIAANGDIASGIIDESYGQITWRIDRKGHLTVEGWGGYSDPKNNASVRIPWLPYGDEIISAKISLKDTMETTYFFYGCEKLEYVDMTDFESDCLTQMQGMFMDCKSLKQIVFGEFDTSKVTDMISLFYGCESLEELDVSNFKLHQYANIWGMFYGCKSLKYLDLSGFQLKNINDCSTFIYGCDSLERIEAPTGLKYWIGLPTKWANEKWFLPSGKTIDCIPQYLGESVTIVRKETDWFRDVYLPSWYTPYVTYVKAHGLMSGYNKRFYPNESITRAMVVQTLYNMEGKPEVTDYKACTKLKDVYNDWYTDAVCWAYNEGITTGYADTKTFKVDRAVTREELATFLYRYVEYKGYDRSQMGDLASLQNVSKVSYYAKDAVNWAVGAGLISGVEIKKDDVVVARDLDPQGAATRGQMAAILQRFCETYEPLATFEWNGHTYGIFDNWSTWEEAKANCESRGGYLAVIGSEEENEALYNFIKENGYTSAYFGLSDTVEEGTWTWVNGEITDYINWNADEPGGGTDENYAMFFYLYEDGTWNDGAFKENVHDGGNAYICEWEPLPEYKNVY